MGSVKLGEHFPLSIFIHPLTARKKKVIVPNFFDNTLQFQLTEKDIERAKHLFDSKQKCYYAFACECVTGIVLTYSQLNGIVSEDDNVMGLAELLNAKVVEL